MKNINPKYIQVAGDALIPIAGYFFWNWGLYFILLYYLIDQVANEVFYHIKAKKINQFHAGKEKSNWIRKGFLSGILLLAVTVLIHLTMLLIQPEINFLAEMRTFWEYKDFGIAQGYLLLPLIILVGFQRYKLEFIMPAKFRILNQATLWKPHIMALYMLLACVALAFGISSLVVMPELVYISGIIVLTSIYQLLTIR